MGLIMIHLADISCCYNQSGLKTARSSPSYDIECSPGHPYQLSDHFNFKAIEKETMYKLILVNPQEHPPLHCGQVYHVSMVEGDFCTLESIAPKIYMVHVSVMSDR